MLFLNIVPKKPESTDDEEKIGNEESDLEEACILPHSPINVDKRPIAIKSPKVRSSRDSEAGCVENAAHGKGTRWAPRPVLRRSPGSARACSRSGNRAPRREAAPLWRTAPSTVRSAWLHPSLTTGSLIRSRGSALPQVPKAVRPLTLCAESALPVPTSRELSAPLMSILMTCLFLL